MISIHEANDWDNLLHTSGTITNSSAQVNLNAAPGVGVRYLILSISLSNPSAVVTTFEIQSASTRRWRINLPATVGLFSQSNPGGLFFTIENEALNVQCSSATSTVELNITYLRIPTAP